MEDQKYSHLGGSGENWKYSWLVGMDARLETMKVGWQECKIGNTQGQVEGIIDQKYFRLIGKVEKFRIFKVRWTGEKDEKYSSLGVRDKRSEILKVRCNG